MQLSALLRILLLLAAALGPSSAHGARHEWQLRRWNVAEGAPSSITAIAQTSDGFLWIGSVTGLYRFDGVSFSRVAASVGASQSDGVNAIVPDGVGGLWVGHDWGGLSHYEAGRHVAVRSDQLGGTILHLLQAGDRSVWAIGGGGPQFFVSRLSGGRWHRRLTGPISLLPQDAALSADGSLWLISGGRIRLLRPGAATLEVVPTAVAADSRFVTDRNGVTWLFANGVLRRMSSSVPRAAAAAAVRMSDPAGLTVLTFDRNGDLWRLSAAGGLARYDGAALSSAGSSLRPTFEDASHAAPGQAAGRPASLVDREGSVWFATELGLDQYRPAAFAVIPETAGPVQQRWSGRMVMRDGTGTVWLRHDDRLYRVDDHGRPVRADARLLPGDVPCAASGKGVWHLGDPGHVLLTGGSSRRTLRLGALAGGDQVVGQGCAEDADGRLWIVHVPRGLASLGTDGAFLPDLGVDAGRIATTLAADRDGGVLAYFGRGGVWMARGRGFRQVWRPADVAIGFVDWMTRTDRGILMGGPLGIARYEKGMFRTLSRRRFPFLAFTSGGAQTDRGETWLQTPEAVVSMSSSDLDRAFDDPAALLPVRSFDVTDGLPGAAAYFNTSSLAADRGGRVWAVTEHGIAVADPVALPRNLVPPPVAITGVRAGDATLAVREALRLPEGTSRMQIGYAGLSFVNPSRVRYRYRLVGVDPGWIDAGSRREAFYTNLAPGDYVFLVTAANNDGVWSSRPARVGITIPPTFAQSRLSRVLALSGLCLLAWLAYRFRVRLLARRLRATLEAQLRERERIARELHDTLLQSVQGIVLRFQAVYERLPAGVSHGGLLPALERADGVMKEARDRIRLLRCDEEPVDVPAMIARCVAVADGSDPSKVETSVEGVAFPMRSAVAMEVEAILTEALLNAERHAKAGRVVVLADFRRSEFVLTVRDDGIGLPDDVARDGGRDGHFGLRGMRERARTLGGRLSVRSGATGGTEVELIVPRSLATS